MCVRAANASNGHDQLGPPSVLAGRVIGSIPLLAQMLSTFFVKPLEPWRLDLAWGTLARTVDTLDRPVIRPVANHSFYS